MPLIPVSISRSFPDLLLRGFKDVHDVVQVVAQLLKRSDGMVAPFGILQTVIAVNDDLIKGTTVFDFCRCGRAELC